MINIIFEYSLVLQMISDHNDYYYQKMIFITSFIVSIGCGPLDAEGSPVFCRAHAAAHVAHHGPRGRHWLHSVYDAERTSR